MMKIEDILKGLKLFLFREIRNILLHGIEFDSRNVTGGSLFIAVKGYKTDGHDYILVSYTVRRHSNHLRNASGEYC